METIFLHKLVIYLLPDLSLIFSSHTIESLSWNLIVEVDLDEQHPEFPHSIVLETNEGLKLQFNSSFSSSRMNLDSSHKLIS